MIRFIISGGQTGVDRAAMDQAMERGMLCTGWCPRGRRAEDGTIPERYPVLETASEEYEERTERNVQDSDGTLVVVDGSPDEGTRTTIEMAYRHEKPFYLLDLQHNIMPDVIAHWVRKFRIQILNVAGPRESHTPGIYEKSRVYLRELYEFFALPEEEQMLSSEGIDEEDLEAEAESE